MIKLYSVHNKILATLNFHKPFIAKITANHNLPYAARADKVLILKLPVEQLPTGFLAILLIEGCEAFGNFQDLQSVILIDKQLSYLDDKDVIKFNPKNVSIQVIYRYGANANSFLLTERCNSFCLMCSR